MPRAAQEAGGARGVVGCTDVRSGSRAALQAATGRGGFTPDSGPLTGSGRFRSRAMSSAGSNASQMAIGLPANLWRAEMRRRDCIAGIGATSIAALTSSTLRAQQATKSVVGFLNAASAVPFAPMVAAFRRGLSSMGYVEGENLTIEFGWGERQPERLSALAADLVAKRVSVIAAGGGLRAVLAAKAATADIPIVFTSGRNPVALGIVASFNRPGGNMTGVNMLITEIEFEASGSASRVGASRYPNCGDD